MSRNRTASQRILYVSLASLMNGCSYTELETRQRESSMYLANPSIIVIEPRELSSMPVIKTDPNCDPNMVRGQDSELKKEPWPPR